MHNITREYLLLFHTLTDMQEELLRLRDRMMLAQAAAEELYLEEGEPAKETECLIS